MSESASAPLPNMSANDKAVSMAEKLRAWKAAKAAQQQQQQQQQQQATASKTAKPAAAAPAATVKSKAAPAATAAVVAPSSKPVAAVKPATAPKTASTVAKPVASKSTKKASASASTSVIPPAERKRAFSTMHAAADKDASASTRAKPAPSKKTKKEAASAKVAPAPAATVATESAPSDLGAVAIDAAQMQLDHADDDDDLGISFSSTEGDALSPQATPVQVAASARLATPVSASLRARLSQMDSQPASAVPAGPAPAATASVGTTPRAAALRASLLLTPPESDRPAGSMGLTAGLTPRAMELSRKLREVTPLASPAQGASHTPHTDRLRASMFAPASSPIAAGSVTPLSNALLLSARREKATPPDQEGSMASLLARSEAIVERVRSATHTATRSGSSRSTPASASSSAASSPSHSTPSSHAHSTDHSSPVVARNLMSEMDGGGDAVASLGLQSLDDSLTCAPLDDEPPTAVEGDSIMTDAAAEADPLAMHVAAASSSMHGGEEQDESAEVDLFAADEFIPGLSTPAPVLQTSLLASPTSMLLQPTPSRTPAHSRLLTPSRAQLAATPATEASALPDGGSTVVLASVKAHPRDAARLGSATFLSPVRRSTRQSRGGGSAVKHGAESELETATPLDELDQPQLERMLEANNFAYQPNPALGRDLTPIPAQRTRKSVAAAPQQQSTPIPPRSLSSLAGSSVVVLQPVRARRSSSHAAALQMPDPKSDEYLLSPVRRSARHTAPQSMSDLTRLLATTKFAYKPNPMLEQTLAPAPVPLSAPTASPAAMARGLSPSGKSLTAIDEAEEEEDEQEEQENEIGEEHADGVPSLPSFSSPSLVSRRRSASASASGSGGSRKGTPMPLSRSQKKMQQESAPMHSHGSAWEQSYSSAGSNDDAYNKSVSAVAEKQQSLLHERDAEGFLIPLPPANFKRGRKRAAPIDENALSGVSSYDDALSAKLAMGAVCPSSIPASGAPRMSTPRPASKKQRRAAPFVMQMMDAATPDKLDGLRRSSRVATPIR